MDHLNCWHKAGLGFVWLLLAYMVYSLITTARGGVIELPLTQKVFHAQSEPRPFWLCVAVKLTGILLLFAASLVVVMG